jgi:hypothetical protein
MIPIKQKKSRYNNIIIHRQQEALATQEDTRTPSTSSACGQVVEGLIEL